MKQLRSIGKWGKPMGGNIGVNRIPFAGLWVLGLIILLIAVASCTPEDEVLTREESVQLLFDRDTVQFDTVFTTVGSTTQWLQVYNPQPKAVNIGLVSLASPEKSPFRLLLNGEAGTQFSNVRLRGGDSLLLLVEVTVDPTNTDLPFIVKDSIQFSTNGNVQYVNLEAWGQDAYFLKSEMIAQDTTFSGERPYVICDSLRVAPEATLTLAAGAQLYFNDGSYLQIDGTLQTAGTSESRITLQHVRQDGDYKEAPGQWQGVFFTSGSKNNWVDFTTIRNANVGISIDAADNDTIPDIVITNTIIENMAAYGVFALNADIDARNTVISDCASGLVYSFGASYNRWLHCTFVNENIGFTREDFQPSLWFDDTLANPGSTQSHRVEIKNSIVWGDLNNELFIVPRRISFERQILYNLIKSVDTTLSTNLFNSPPAFVDPLMHNYHLDSLSPAIDAGVPLGIERDLEDKPRDAQPDLGAYEYHPE